LSRGIVSIYVKFVGIGIIRQKSGQEIFFRRSSINTKSPWSLAPGDRVNFEIEKTEKGLQAKNIKKV